MPKPSTSTAPPDRVHALRSGDQATPAAVVSPSALVRVRGRRSFILLEERAVEEAGDALFVLMRPSIETTDMPRLLDLPQGLRFGGRLEVVRVELLAATPVTGVDQEEGAW